jgi:hypothetical protein
MTLPGSTLPPITTLLGSKGLQFTGCNSLALLCSINSAGSFQTGNVVAGSQRQCQNNNDQGYLQALMGGDSYVQQGNNFYITQRGNKIADFQYVGLPQSTGFPATSLSSLSNPIIFPATVTARIGGVLIGSRIPIPGALPALSSLASLSMPSISITPQSQNYGMYGVPSMPYNN